MRVALDEGDMARVEGLMEGGSPGSSASERDTVLGGFAMQVLLVMLAQVLGGLHGKLAPVERMNQIMVWQGEVIIWEINESKIWTYPDPNDSGPASRDTVDLGEVPVTVGGNDRQNGLG